MVAILVVYYVSSVLLSTVSGDGISSIRENNRHDSTGITSRDIYGGFGYPYPPFLEPLNILAILGFLAFLVQTFHAIYQTHNSGGLVGGLLNNVLPGSHRKWEGRQNENMLNAIEIYNALNKWKKRKKRKTHIPK